MSETNVVYVPNTAANGESSTNGQTIQKNISVQVTPDRLDDIKVKHWIEVEKGSITGMIELIAYFIWNGHSYYQRDEALDIVNEFTTKQLRETAQTVMDAASNAVASPQ